MSTRPSWFSPRRDWAGRNALVPIDTCYRILDLYAWSFAVMGTIAVIFVGSLYRNQLLQAPAFRIAALAVLVQWVATIFRGLPFLVRYGVFAANLLVFLVCTTAVMAITPNWSFLVILLLSSAGLLFGTAVGLWASAGLCAIHVLIAWAWVAGYFPVGKAITAPVSAYSDFRSAAVWARVLIMSSGLLAVLQLLMRYVLGDMNRALAEANSALGQLTAEQERRARLEQKFTALFDQSPDICGVTRVRDAVFLDVNRAFETLTGWTRAEAVGRTAQALGFWLDAATREQAVKLAMEKGELTGHEIPWSTRAGQRRIGLLSMRPMEIDGEQVLNVVIRDITDRRRRERELQAFTERTAGLTGREFFAATVRHLATELGVRFAFIVEVTARPGGAAAGRTLAAWKGGPADDFSYDLPGSPCENVIAGGFCHYPDRVAELFPRDRGLSAMKACGYAGLPIHDHNGQAFGLVAVLDDRPMPEVEAASLLLVLVAARAAAELQRLRTEREIKQLNAELEARVRDRTAELAARVAEVERLNVDQQTLMRDLRTSQQSADRTAARLQEVNSNLLAANQELEAFSYSVSHDLRAPLRNITGFLELLARRANGKLDPEAERFVTVVNTEATRMGLLIDDLLTFSRIGRTEMQLQPVDLAALVAGVRDDLKTDIGERSIAWEVGALPTVRGDPVLLRQVVANLLDNAVKFTRHCPLARIAIGASPPVRGERTVTVFVRDNGAGFNPKYLDKLFGVFQRLHNAKDFEGTGIGLANVKRIITRHGGRVWAEGQVDRGATFYVTLPAAQP